MFGLKERITRCKEASYEPPVVKISKDMIARIISINIIKNHTGQETGIDILFEMPDGNKRLQRIDFVDIIKEKNKSENMAPDRDYKIYTKDDFIKSFIIDYLKGDADEHTIKRAVESFDRIRNGHKFVIGVGKNRFCSVEYLEETLLG